MVICEDPHPEIDLKCKDKMADSDNDLGQDEDADRKCYGKQRLSPVRDGQNVTTDVTCRPRAVKGNNR